MIGNDIVDLQVASIQSDWKRKGFLEKQFTEKEKEEILKSNTPSLLVWLFWSMKEAAYKCYVQQYQKRFFNPKKCSCYLENDSKGIVTINEEKYYTRSMISEKNIHTIAVKQKDTKIVSEVSFIENTAVQSKLTNNRLLSSFSKETVIKKNESGVPYLYLNNQKLTISFSTSHHGNYGGFVILK